MIEKTKLFGYDKKEYRPFIREKTEELLKSILEEKQPKRILEIGTFLGYSALVMRETCPNAQIVTLEKDVENFGFASKNLEGKNIKLLNVDASDFLLSCEENSFDFVFLDGPKGQYYKYLPFLKKVLSEKGMIFADDVLFYGLVSCEGNVKHKHRSLVNNLRKFIEMAKTDETLETKFYDFVDGVAIIQKKSN